MICLLVSHGSSVNTNSGGLRMPGHKALIGRRHYRLSADSNVPALCTRERISIRMKASLIMFEISWETCSSQFCLASILQPIAVTVQQHHKGQRRDSMQTWSQLCQRFTRMNIKYDTNLSRRSFSVTQSVGILLAACCSSPFVPYNVSFCLLIVL